MIVAALMGCATLKIVITLVLSTAKTNVAIIIIACCRALLKSSYTATQQTRLLLLCIFTLCQCKCASNGSGQIHKKITQIFINESLSYRSELFWWSIHWINVCTCTSTDRQTEICFLFLYIYSNIFVRFFLF